MQLALEQARIAESQGEVPVGAVIIKDGQVVAVGHNQPIGSHDPTAHAEIVAMRAAAAALGNYRLDGCALYVTLEPCSMCAGAILESRVQQVIYGAREPKTGAAGSVINLFDLAQLNHHTAITSGVLEAESRELLTQFFLSRRRQIKASAQPLREDAVRTPPDCFAPADTLFQEGKYLEIGGDVPKWRLHYVDAGPQEAALSVILVHDVPGWGYRWNALLLVLAEAGIRVLAPDLLGFGRSDKPKKRQAHSEALHFQSLDAMAALLNPKSRTVLVGQGVGLQLAHHWSARQNELISEVLAVMPSSPGTMDRLPHPNRGFVAGLDFFAEWAQVNTSVPLISAKPYALDAPQAILTHLKSIEATG